MGLGVGIVPLSSSCRYGLGFHAFSPWLLGGSCDPEYRVTSWLSPRALQLVAASTPFLGCVTDRFILAATPVSTRSAVVP